MRNMRTVRKRILVALLLLLWSSFACARDTASGDACPALRGQLVINLFMASVAGILVPLTLDRMGRDPAVSSPVFVTFVTDFIGFLSFLGLAALIIL